MLPFPRPHFFLVLRPLSQGRWRTVCTMSKHCLSSCGCSFTAVVWSVSCPLTSVTHRCW